MSEYGDTPVPPQGHQSRRRRRRILICAASAVMALLLLAAAAAVAALVVLRPRDPVTELLSVNATGVLPGVVTLPAVSTQLNITFLLAVRVRNPNAVAFRHGAAATSLLYRGAEVGGGEVPAGTVPSKGAAIVRLNMTVLADRFLAAVGIEGLVADVLDGEMEFETRTSVPGKVVILGFIKRRVEARSVCRVVIRVADLQVRRQECHNEAKL